MSKLYRLKEELKKYFHYQSNDLDIVEDEYHFINMGISLEALEEVESKIEVFRHIINSNAIYLQKGTSKEGWTEQERELVEFVINEFGDIKNLDNKINDYACYFSEKDGFANLFEWLKQIKD